VPLADHTLILARGPYTVPEEQALFSRLGVLALVSKNSGGEATQAKLIAARALNIPVVMVRRPDPVPGPQAETVEQALAWIAERLAAV
jgi:precorrin-6A/cobalt-precorrin-6A reductase